MPFHIILIKNFILFSNIVIVQVNILLYYYIIILQSSTNPSYRFTIPPLLSILPCIQMADIYMHFLLLSALINITFNVNINFKHIVYDCHLNFMFSACLATVNALYQVSVCSSCYDFANPFSHPTLESLCGSLTPTP